MVRLLPSSSRRKEAEVWGVDLPRGPKGGLPNGGAGVPRPAEPLEVLLSAEVHRSLGRSLCVSDSVGCQSRADPERILPKRARFVSCRQSQATDWSVVLAGGRTRTAGLLLREAGQPLALDVTRRRPRRRRRHRHTQARAAAPSPGLRGRAPPERRQAPRTPGDRTARGRRHS